MDQENDRLSTIERPISQKQMKDFLSISEPTLIKLRKNGSVPYLSVLGKIMYQPSEVIEALTIKPN